MRHERTVGHEQATFQPQACLSTEPPAQPWQTDLHTEPFSTSAIKLCTRLIATATKICTGDRSGKGSPTCLQSRCATSHLLAVPEREGNKGCARG